MDERILKRLLKDWVLAEKSLRTYLYQFDSEIPCEIGINSMTRDKLMEISNRLLITMAKD